MKHFDAVLEELIHAFEQEGHHAWASELRPLVGQVGSPDRFLQIANNPSFGETLEDGTCLDLLWEAWRTASEIRKNRSLVETIRMTTWREGRWALLMFGSIAAIIIFVLVIPLIQAIQDL